jgi:hypothetical protein
MTTPDFPELRLRDITAVGGIRIFDVLTNAQAQRAWSIYKAAMPGTFARTVESEVITPNIKAISMKLGQQMLPRYVAYMIEYFFNEASR